jgi:branched-chain amino acid aminotransferase
MELIAAIPVTKVLRSKIDEVDFDNLEFGKYVSDHMLVCDYVHGEWQTPQIVPFEDMQMSPATLALHYGQTIFEGMKAFRMEDGRINIPRIEKHHQRFVQSAERMCMAEIPKDVFVEGLLQLIELDKAWVPSQAGDALYIRPFMYASEARFGVKVSEEYRFIIFTGPVPSLYAKPIKVKVETNYVRAAKGGTGAAKCGGNYGAAFYPTAQARKAGYDQVLWTDAATNSYIEESGTMNAMFVINGILVTPETSDSILDGITRDSLLTLANDLGYTTEERPVSIYELEVAFANGSITEAFGTGTAAVVAPIKTISINDIDYQLPAYTESSLLNRLSNHMLQVRQGTMPDVHGWNTVI